MVSISFQTEWTSLPVSTSLISISFQFVCILKGLRSRNDPNDRTCIARGSHSKPIGGFTGGLSTIKVYLTKERTRKLMWAHERFIPCVTEVMTHRTLTEVESPLPNISYGRHISSTQRCVYISDNTGPRWVATKQKTKLLNLATCKNCTRGTYLLEIISILFR